MLVACAPKPEPRTVSDFMDDGLAREGVLTRCNQNREETLNDEECTNARRAAATLALEAERARTPQLEERSAARQVAMRQDDSPPTLGRPSLKIEAVAPPSNDLVITAPPLDVPKLAVAPRPLRDETAQR